MIGRTLDSAIQEKFYFYGELDTESMGSLTLKFTNGQKFTFDCDGDAESLKIEEGGFKEKGTLAKDFVDNRYKWEEEEFLRSGLLHQLGRMSTIYIEITTNEFGTTQSGCKIDFVSGDHLYIWTVPSDNLFYGLNVVPPYDRNENLEIKLIDILSLNNHGDQGNE